MTKRIILSRTKTHEYRYLFIDGQKTKLISVTERKDER
jgi:hypothetical protein